FPPDTGVYRRSPVTEGDRMRVYSSGLSDGEKPTAGGGDTTDDDLGGFTIDEFRRRAGKGAGLAGGNKNGSSGHIEANLTPQDYAAPQASTNARALTLGVGRAALAERKDDLYQTPECAVRSLLEVEPPAAVDLGTGLRSWRYRQRAPASRSSRLCHRSR